MTDYNSLISAVASLLSDKSPDVVIYAQSAIIEMGKPAASKVSSVLIRELNSFSSNNQKNRPVILQAIRDICKYSPESGLAHLVAPHVIDLLTFLPQLEKEITDPCIEILHNFADRNAVDVVQEFKEINVTSGLTKFLTDRAKKNEKSFFSSGDRPTLAFTRFCQGVSKVTDNETRVGVVGLFTQLTEVFGESTESERCGIAGVAGEAMEIMSSTWLKTSSVDVQRDILECLGSAAALLGKEGMRNRLDGIAQSYAAALTTKDLKQWAARGVSSLLLAAEKSGCAGRVPAQSLTKALYDFVASEMSQMQSDGNIMRAVNEAVGALGTLMILAPPHSLDFVKTKLPSPPALFCVAYICSSLAGDYPEVAVSIVKALSGIGFPQLKGDQKELYCNCFVTLIRKLKIDPISEISTIFRNVSEYISTNTPEARGIAHSFVASVKQTPGSAKYLYPSVLKFMMDPSLFFASPSLAEAAAVCVTSHARGQSGVEDNLELASLALTLSESSLMTEESKVCLRTVAFSLLEVSNFDDFIRCRHPEEHSAVLQFVQKLVGTYGNYSVNGKPVFSPTVRAAFRGGAAVVSAKLMRSPHCAKELESVTSSILGRMDRTSFVELESIASYLGIVSEVQPEFAASLVKRSIDVIMRNRENKWKFWAKKEEPPLPEAAVLLSTAELFDRSSSSMLTNIFREIQDLIADESVSSEIRMRAVAAGFRRAHRDKGFSVGDGRRLAVMADASLKSAKTASEVVAGIEAVTAAYVFDPSLVGGAEGLVKSSMGAIRPEFSSSEVDCIISRVTDVVVSVVSANRSVGFIVMFNNLISKYVTSEGHFECGIQSIGRVFDSLPAVEEQSLTEFKKVALFYSAVALWSEDDTAVRVSLRALSLITNSDIKEINASSIVGALVKAPDDLEALVEGAAGLAVCPFGVQKAGVEILHAASATAAGWGRAGEYAGLLFHAYGAGLDVKECFDGLVESHAGEVMGALVKSEYSRRLSNVVGSIVTRRETSRAGVGALVEALEALDERSATVLRVMSDCADSLRLGEFRERGVFGALSAGLMLGRSGVKEALEWAAAVVGTECAPSSVPLEAFRSLLERSRSDSTKLLDLSERILSKAGKGSEGKEVALAAAAAVIETTAIAEVGHRAVSLIIESDVDEASVDAIASIGRACPAVRREEGLRAVGFLGSAPRELAARSMAAVVGSLSDAQMREASDTVIGFALGVLADGPEDSAAAAAGLRVVPLIAGSNALMCAEGGLRAAASLFPLCVVHAFATDRELGLRAASALGRRLALPEPRGGAQTFPEFADANVAAAFGQVKERAAFAEAAERAMGHESPRVRAAAVYLATVVAEERPSVVEKVSQAMRDESEEVRASALRTITVLETKK